MSTKHSPGPWKWVVDENGDDKLRDVDGCDVFDGEWMMSHENAVIVEAAPELVKALRWAMDILDAQNPCDGCGPSCSNHRARALIARIDGPPTEPSPTGSGE